MVLPSIFLRANRQQTNLNFYVGLIRLTECYSGVIQFSFFRRSAQSAVGVFQCPQLFHCDFFFGVLLQETCVSHCNSI